MATKANAPSAESLQRAKVYLIKWIKKGDVASIGQLDRILGSSYPIEEPIESYGKVTLLMYAASVSKVPGVLSVLLDHGADLSATDSVGRTPLHHCCLGGD